MVSSLAAVPRAAARVLSEHSFVRRAGTSGLRRRYVIPTMYLHFGAISNWRKVRKMSSRITYLSFEIVGELLGVGASIGVRTLVRVGSKR